MIFQLTQKCVQKKSQEVRRIVVLQQQKHVIAHRRHEVTFLRLSSCQIDENVDMVEIACHNKMHNLSKNSSLIPMTPDAIQHEDQQQMVHWLRCNSSPMTSADLIKLKAMATLIFVARRFERITL